MKSYNLLRIGQLLYTTGAIKGKEKVLNSTLLVDTGSLYTIIPWEDLEAIGLNPASARERIRLITGSGTIVAPRIKVKWFSCLGLKLNSFTVVAHTLPLELARFGVLGMDFLRTAKTRIDVFSAQAFIRNL